MTPDYEVHRTCKTTITFTIDELRAIANRFTGYMNGTDSQVFEKIHRGISRIGKKKSKGGM